MGVDAFDCSLKQPPENKLIIKFSSRSNVAPHDVASRGIIRGQAYDMIDWGFINDTERLNVGSIRQLTVKHGLVPIDFFNKLADIGTIRDRRH